MPTALDHQITALARQIISKKSRWTKGSLATTRSGRWVDPHSPSAYRFCMLGALERATYDLTASSMASAIAAGVGFEIECFGRGARILSGTIGKTGHFESLQDFNDAPATTHAQVLKFFDEFLPKTSPSLPGPQPDAEYPQEQSHRAAIMECV
jgi:hypothetical protein